MRKSAFLIVAAVGLTATTAYADPPPCDTLPDEPVAGAIPKLYIENGDTQEPMLTAMGKLLIKSGTPLRIIYRNRPTCSLKTDLYTDAHMHMVVDGTTARPVKYIQVDTTQPPTECSVPSDDASSQPIALGIGATFLSSCTAAITNPDALVDQFPGPVLAYGFITNNKNSQNGITFEEAYLAYGFPEGAGGASPWLIQNLRFMRSATASTTLTMSAAMEVPPASMQAILATAAVPPQPESSVGLMTAVENSTNPEATLGILGMDLRDANTSLIKMLPFKAKYQRYAYYPDKTETTHDRQNVRDGHYTPWAPTPYIAVKDAATGLIKDPNAKRFYDLVMGNSFATDDVNGLKVISQVGLVPQCAMKVTRDADGTDLRAYSDPTPCSCYYEANVPAAAASSCTVCTDDSPCNGGKCRFGYCEAK